MFCVRRLVAEDEICLQGNRGTDLKLKLGTKELHFNRMGCLNRHSLEQLSKQAEVGEAGQNGHNSPTNTVYLSICLFCVSDEQFHSNDMMFQFVVLIYKSNRYWKAISEKKFLIISFNKGLFVFETHFSSPLLNFASQFSFRQSYFNVQLILGK